MILEAEADLVPMGPRSPLRFGRCVAGAPWVQGLRFASVGAEQTSPGCLAVSAPLRSLQNRRPPDVLQPIFRKASVVMGQAGYTYSVQDCILDQKERSIL